MAQTLAACLRQRLHPDRSLRLAAFGLAALGGGLFSVPALAQAKAPAASPPVRQEPVCSVQHGEQFGPAVGTARPVVALCGGHGLMLGHADTFEVYPNESLGAVLVDLRRGNDRRVLLISLHGEGRPLLEDLSGQISMAAGKGPMSPLEGIGIDVAGFASDGRVAVRGRPEDNGGTAKTGDLDLGQQIAQVRAGRWGGAAQN